MASFASSATTGGARKHAWTNIYTSYTEVNKLQSCKFDQLHISFLPAVSLIGPLAVLQSLLHYT